MIHKILVLRDTCVGEFLVPMFFQNVAAAVRALSDVVNKPSEDNLFKHPEHFQLYDLGSFDSDDGMFESQAPVFIIDCQSLVRSTS